MEASYEFSYVRAGPCAYPQIKEQYTLELSQVDDSEEEDGWGWDWKQSNLVQFLLYRLRQDGGAALKPSDIRLTTLCLLYTSPSPRDATLSRMPSSA